jgi:hypothetical protein
MFLHRLLPARRKRALLSIVLGLVLVFNPLYLDPLGIGAERYEYRTAQVTPSENSLQYHSEVPDEVKRLKGVDCYFDVNHPIECEIPGVIADGQNRSAVVRDTSRWNLHSYIHVNGSFYRRYYWSDPLGPVNESVPDDEKRTNITVQFRDVETRDVLEDVSLPVDAFEEEYRAGIRDGRLVTDEPLRFDRFIGPNIYQPRGQIVTLDGEYYLLGLHEYEPVLEYRGLYSFIGLVLGTICLYYGGRLRALTESGDRQQN